jgi:hypothetical protein
LYLEYHSILFASIAGFLGLGQLSDSLNTKDLQLSLGTGLVASDCGARQAKNTGSSWDTIAAQTIMLGEVDTHDRYRKSPGLSREDDIFDGCVCLFCEQSCCGTVITTTWKIMEEEGQPSRSYAKCIWQVLSVGPLSHTIRSDRTHSGIHLHPRWR